MNYVIASVGQSHRRLGEIRARLAQDLVRTLEFAIHSFELFHPLSLIARDAGALALINFCFTAIELIAAHCDVYSS